MKAAVMVSVPTRTNAGSELAGSQVGLVADAGAAFLDVEARLISAGAVVRRINPTEPQWWQRRRSDAFLLHVALGDELDPTPFDAPSAVHQRLIVLLEQMPGAVFEAADFVVAPFDPAEIVTRLERVLRDASRRGEVIRSGNLCMETARRVVTINDKPVDITFREFEVLRLLLGGGGAVLSREDLQRQLGHGDGAGRSRAMDLHIHRLRTKLHDWVGGGVETVRNVGYRSAVVPGSISVAENE